MPPPYENVLSVVLERFLNKLFHVYVTFCQSVITSSKLAIETVEQDVKYVHG